MYYKQLFENIFLFTTIYLIPNNPNFLLIHELHEIHEIFSQYTKVYTRCKLENTRQYTIHDLVLHEHSLIPILRIPSLLFQYFVYTQFYSNTSYTLSFIPILPIPSLLFQYFVYPHFYSNTSYTLTFIHYFLYPHFYPILLIHHFYPILGTSFYCNTWYLILL